MDLEQYLYGRVAPLIRSWREKGIYAVSFFVYSNEAYVYRGTENVSIFAVSYHTEADCNHAGPLSEERWNDAFWQRDETYIIDAEEGNECMEKLCAWYAENGIKNVGYEGDCGTGPVGYPELVRIVSRVARRIQNEKILQKQFGGAHIGAWAGELRPDGASDGLCQPKRRSRRLFKSRVSRHADGGTGALQIDSKCRKIRDQALTNTDFPRIIQINLYSY